ncbi:putative lipoxygenase 5 [Phragmites australis]|uniref:putative lipoxygenase 5 n=1 Tax=Phragmites australis TaxID=29695 RepID=UPI002D789DAC|nr:putative lipoxygenase 5 [Phragmites australis]
MASSMELLGRSFLPGSAGVAAAVRERGGGLCFAAVGRQGRRRQLRSTAPVGALAERAVVTPAPAERPGAAPPESHPQSVAARAVVTVRRRRKEDAKQRVVEQLDAYADRVGRSVLLELVSTETDPRKGGPKKSKRSRLVGWFEKKDVKAERVVYTAEFSIDASFGEPGAVTVLNRHTREFFIESIVVEGFPSGPAQFTCNSWVQPTRVDRNPRVFFTNKPYLPSETPPGLQGLRRQELTDLRGDGTGERRTTDRVYDYDVYNDLGHPDKGAEFARPVLGGELLPYPRRMRTGRPSTATDERAESRVEYPEPIYVSRDEEFEEGKNEMLSEGALKALLHNFMPLLVSSVSPDIQDFAGFHDVDNLFKEGLRMKQALQDQLFQKIPFVRKIQENSEGLLRYDTPDIIKKDKFAWLRDDEFARQALAGINPVNIERLRAFPLVSKLDPVVYGPPESAITEEHIIGQLDGMSVQQALQDNRLYMLDFHDIFLPFLDQINAQDGRKAYGTRTLFFLTASGTLKPIAIELCLPPMTDACKRAKRVFTPPADATSNWLWQLAKAHVCSNDAGVHQLVNHWLRTHACMEPFIIAAHRQMSAMHPIFKLLKPHMRYTLKINALARQILINGDGVIESGFTPGRYCMEMSAFAYRELWRFDQEGLPADLLRRGMAVEDPTQPHGLRLLIEDYPYATDGLLLWSAISRWCDTYVAFYYPSDEAVQSDNELQSWYAEAVQTGHEDKRDAPWWPRLSTPSDLASLLTTLLWLTSAQHAALNFGQYPLGGYIPNRPPLMRRLVPAAGDPEYAHLVADPHRFFLSALPSLTQTTTFMTVIDTLSTHSADEEYLGERPDEAWTADPAALAAAREFAADVGQAEEEIERRNADTARRNRCGAGVLPYELMAPSSEPGITCRGIPNSVTI